MAILHQAPHPQAGQLVPITTGEFAGQQCRIEDWWDRIAGSSWFTSCGNSAAINYGLRAVTDFSTGKSKEVPPFDNEVIWGRIDGQWHIIHISEFELAGAIQ